MMLRVVLLLIPLAAIPQDFSAVAPRVVRRIFPVIAWGGSPSDPAALRLMQQAGIKTDGPGSWSSTGA
jgi:hypothetical protein